MSRRIPEIGGAVVCFALAIAFAFAFMHYRGETDASSKLMRVEADFSAPAVRDVEKRGLDGKQRSDEQSVDAVYRIDGKTYRHRVSEEYALRVVKSLPGRGAILVDATDPTRPPRSTPVGFAGAPLLASIISALVGVMFAVSAWRHRKRAPDA
jgi:hypothetical protein